MHQLSKRRVPRKSSQIRRDVTSHYVEDKSYSEVREFTKGKKLKPLIAASLPEHFPEELFPEVCVIGRSNVGKSSLVNTLTNTFSAPTSSKPGETKSLHWYSLPGIAYFVDLPGYGFAFSSEENISSWSNSIKFYLEHRRTLRRCLILIDSRVGFKKSDIDMMDYLDS